MAPTVFAFAGAVAQRGRRGCRAETSTRAMLGACSHGPSRRTPARPSVTSCVCLGVPPVALPISNSRSRAVQSR
eukprot:5446533-Lingulodinium_polyedra.AAC.1